MEKLLRKDSVLKWSANCQKSFDQVNCILMSPLTLTHVQPDHKLFLAADASNYGVGVVLFS